MFYEQRALTIRFHSSLTINELLCITIFAVYEIYDLGDISKPINLLWIIF